MYKDIFHKLRLLRKFVAQGNYGNQVVSPEAVIELIDIIIEILERRQKNV